MPSASAGPRKASDVATERRESPLFFFLVPNRFSKKKKKGESQKSWGLWEKRKEGAAADLRPQTARRRHCRLCCCCCRCCAKRVALYDFAKTQGQGAAFVFLSFGVASPFWFSDVSTSLSLDFCLLHLAKNTSQSRPPFWFFAIGPFSRDQTAAQKKKKKKELDAMESPTRLFFFSVAKGIKGRRQGLGCRIHLGGEKKGLGKKQKMRNGQKKRRKAFFLGGALLPILFFFSFGSKDAKKTANAPDEGKTPSLGDRSNV